MSRPLPRPVIHIPDPGYMLDLSGARVTVGGELVVHVDRPDHTNRVHIGPNGVIGESVTDRGRCGCRNLPPGE